MVIHVIPEASEIWQELVKQEAETGDIPLPVVDTLILDEDRAPSIAIVAPDILLGSDHIFVAVDQLTPSDQLILETNLGFLRDWSRRAGLHGRLAAVMHCGGLDYEFRGSNTLRLLEAPTDLQPTLWAILREIAEFGARNPDVTASTIVQAVPDG